MGYAKTLADLGRFGDTELAHLTPGEIVVPKSLQTNEVIQALIETAKENGIDLARYIVKDTDTAQQFAPPAPATENPFTGAQEFFDIGDLARVGRGAELIGGIGTTYGGPSAVGAGANWLANMFPGTFGIQTAIQSAPALSAMGGMGEMAAGTATQIGAGAAIAPFLSAALPIVGLGLGMMLPSIMNRNNRPPGFYGSFSTLDHKPSNYLNTWGLDENNTAFMWGEKTPPEMQAYGRSIYDQLAAGQAKLKELGVTPEANLNFHFAVDPYGEGLYTHVQTLASDGSEMANEDFFGTRSLRKYQSPDELVAGFFTDYLTNSANLTPELQTALEAGLTPQALHDLGIVDIEKIKPAANGANAAETKDDGKTDGSYIDFVLKEMAGGLTGTPLDWANPSRNRSVLTRPRSTNAWLDTQDWTKR